jgi:hypothetical protein
MKKGYSFRSYLPLRSSNVANHNLIIVASKNGEEIVKLVDFGISKPTI